MNPDYDWFVQNAHKDDAWEFMVQDLNLFEESIRGRCVSVHRTDVQGCINQAKWRVRFEPHHYAAMTSILAGIQPLSTYETELRKIDGPIRTENRCFRDNGGSFSAWGVGAFWLPWSRKIENRNHFDRFIEWAHACHFNSVRFFGSHDWHGGCDPSEPGYWDLMGRTLESLQDAGLRAEVTLASRRKLIKDDAAYVRAWAQLLQNYEDTVLMAEIANESQHPDNGPWKDQRIRELAYIFREVNEGTPLALSSPCSTLSFSKMEPKIVDLYRGCSANDVVTCHFPRADNETEGWGRWVRQPYHLHSGIAGTNARLMASNEPQRWDRSHGGRIVEAAMCNVLNGWVCGMGLVNHHDQQSVFPDHPFGDQECDLQLATTCRRVLPEMPDDLANWKTVRTGRQDHPFPELVNHHYAFDEGGTYGTSRAYAAVRRSIPPGPPDVKEFVCVLTRVKDYVPLEERERAFRVLSLRTGEEVYAGQGPVLLHETDAQAFVVIG
jgi:hypothetical protein